MTPSYSIRALARADLEEIWLFTLEEWGLEQADKYPASFLVLKDRLERSTISR